MSASIRVAVIGVGAMGVYLVKAIQDGKAGARGKNDGATVGVN